ncbi:MAG: aminodeoxychorismate synthase, component I [Arenimonas sp. SCN 70-307]|uniref:aminodeoxychorismate synthase component I n=1 Tax=Arenimonas sp. SCN 70-307 TaxID=1660089 RepID=UPI00086F7024|nr:aminodeoxychorismate synthase component I [Arenimonas sp. SCN 70-307]ODS64722.1 MAG: aminodeoxychorismate synthase, component I [Arenimonas sp. SCN 70-307]
MDTLALPPGTDLLRLQAADPGRFPLLLESVAGGNALSRWDLLLATDGSGLRLDADGRVRALETGEEAGTDFLAALDQRWAAARQPVVDATLPFRGGWALFFAYELAAQVEPRLRLPAAPGPLPVAIAWRCPAAVLRDRASGDCLAVAEAGAGDWLARLAAAPMADAPAGFEPPALSEDEPARFTDGVARIHDYLRAGDVFQVNLSRAWRARFATPPDPAAVYARLRENNPAPFAGLMRLGDAALLSSSPERLVSVRGRRVDTRPIAGTRPRFPGDDDQARIRDLVGNPKERAEHVMLIDLERNDLGRVCTPGSVRVDELMGVESYAHVHHIVSNVTGTLREGTTPGEVVRAVFPGGTITGAPKVRCMEIIAELEGEGRGAYTGAFGYLGNDGDLDLNILIRSAWLQGGELQFRTGAGIVVDSDAGRELDETRAKARGLLRALGAAG